MRAPPELVVNGQPTPLVELEAGTRLLDVLRSLGLPGAKEGCGEGECGACAVLCARRDRQGRTRLEAVNSCLVVGPSLPGLHVWTSEALASGSELHPVQRAMCRFGGSQCGYCTPGFVISMAAEYYRPDRSPGEADPEAIGGNLCRCTGYRPIRDALGSLGAVGPNDAFIQRLAQPTPAAFAWAGPDAEGPLHRPLELDQVVELLRRYPDARLVHGATDLGVEMHHGRARPVQLISLEAVAALRVFEEDAQHLRIGAGLPLSEVEQRLGGAVPLLEQLWPLFSSRLIRGRATLGGNLATASPIGDGSLALLALDAEAELLGQQGVRRLPLSEFFVGYRETQLAATEVIVSVRIPLPLAGAARFYKVSKRNQDDISIVAAAFAVHLRQGAVAGARLAYGGVAPTPVRALAAERALIGKPWGPTAIADASAALQGEFTPLGDHRGSADYRRALAAELLQKFWYETRA
ncbi:MAG: FAD binding domain-containing protein [Myxococcales bacterium]|nr:FAD binding domain-containing protein [Myxococcales bacterium]